MNHNYSHWIITCFAACFSISDLDASQVSQINPEEPPLKKKKHKDKSLMSVDMTDYSCLTFSSQTSGEFQSNLLLSFSPKKEVVLKAWFYVPFNLITSMSQKFCNILVVHEAQFGCS